MCNSKQGVQSGLTPQDILDAITALGETPLEGYKPTADTSMTFRYRWGAMASLQNGDVNRALVYATLAQASATEALSRS